MRIINKPVLQFSLIVKIPDDYCFWCERELMPCGLCEGSGLYKGSDCNDCYRQGRICPTHQGDWKP